TWDKGQLGQITQLLSGRDRGFRGAATLVANLSGTPQALAIESRMSINGFRRYDIVDNRVVNLTTGCTANYSVNTRSLSDLICQSPVGGGLLRLRGNAGTAHTMPDGSANHAGNHYSNRTSDSPYYKFTLEAENVPLSSMLALLHQAKQQLPADLEATGAIDGELYSVREGGRTEFTGNGKATDVRLVSNAGKDTIELGNVPLTLAGDLRSGELGSALARAKSSNGARANDVEPSEPHLRMGPASLQVNTSSAVGVGGWISASGYRFFLRGDLELKDLFRVETALGLPSVRPAAEGDARLDVSVSGQWRGLAQPNALGTAQLRNVRAETHGLNAPIEISAATVVLEPGTFSMEKILAQTGDTHWTGSVSAPRHCAPACVFQFDLTADHLSSDVLARWLKPQAAKRPWYRILNSGDPQGPSPLLAIQARGNLRVGRLDLKRLAATQVATELRVERGKLTMTNLRATVFQGMHQGNWTVDASVVPPRYRGSGTFQNASLAQLSTLMNDAWIAGTAEGVFDVDTSGENFGDLAANCDGKLTFVMKNGSLAHVQFPGMRGPLAVHRFAGELRAKKGVWELSGGRLESRDGIYQVSGTVEPDTGLKFVFTRSDEQSWNLTGTLAKPHVSPVNQEISRKEANTTGDSKP
ncbi:MAG: AsmA family protein, partial [Terriglobales bacterium]